MIIKTLFMTEKMKFIDKKKFATTALDIESKTIVMYIKALNLKRINIIIHFF